MDIIKHSFSAGEFSREVQARSDLELYDLGAKKLHNFVVNYGGGAYKRRGTRFCELLQHPESHIRFFAFRFAQNLDSSYIVIFGDGYVRFALDGRYVLEATKTVTIGGQSFTVPTHGYSNGNLLSVSSHPDVVVAKNVTANTLRVETLFGDDLTLAAGATVARVLTLSNPFEPIDIWQVTTHQYLNQVKFTHKDYPPYVLTRFSSTWTMEEEEKGCRRAASQRYHYDEFWRLHPGHHREGRWFGCYW